MTTIRSAPRSLAEIAEAFVLSRQVGSVVSVADGVKHCRRLAPACDHTDEELGEMIATLAIRHGRNLSFDLQPTWPIAA